MTSDWRPIETAPKDGTWVEVFYFHDGEVTQPEACLASWRKFERYLPAGWARRFMREDDLPFEPTHWRPFGPPPARLPTDTAPRRTSFRS
jgi:hypothetical protein